MVKSWKSQCGTVALFSILGCPVASGADSFAGIILFDGATIEEFNDEGPTSSIVDARSMASPFLLDTGTGSAFAAPGVLRASIEGTPTTFGAVIAVLGYEDTITFFSNDLAPGESGTLHLEFSIDGTVNVPLFSGGSISLTLVNEDFPDLNTIESLDALEGPDTYGNYSENWSEADFEILPEDPITVTLDIPVTNGQQVTYGAALLLTLVGDGVLDFSQTVTLSDATLTDSSNAPVTQGQVSSSSGLTYGSFASVPEPGPSFLLALAAAIGIIRRRRS